MDRPLISEHEMIKESEIFHKIYSVFINEIEQIESVRGKPNDFQLMLAVSRAKDTMGILNWERRQTINSIFEKYTHIYRVFGRSKADEWVRVTFGFEGSFESVESGAEVMEIEYKNHVPRFQEISRLIVEKESELLQLYREFYLLQQGIYNGEG